MGELMFIPGPPRELRKQTNYAGVDGVVNLAAAVAPKQWSCWASAAGATVTILSHAGTYTVELATPVPLNGSLSGTFHTEEATDYQLTFTGTAGYLVECVGEEPAP